VASSYADGASYPIFGADGILGMGFKEFSALNAAPFFETIIDQGQLKGQEPVFAFSLAGPGSGSELIIGGRNSSLYSGNLTYVNVIQKVRILRCVYNVFLVFVLHGHDTGCMVDHI